MGAHTSLASCFDNLRGGGNGADTEMGAGKGAESSGSVMIVFCE